MITKILLIRHGKSVANEKDLFGGDTDYPLCEEGHKEAQRLANRLRNIQIDEIYSSHLIRAKKTVEPISEILNKEVKIEEDLREMYVGKWEDIPWGNLSTMYPEKIKRIKDTRHFTGIEGQEETSDVAQRMLKVITNIAKENAGKTIVISSHMISIGAFLCVILGIPFEQTKDKIGRIHNTSITFMDYDNIENKFKVLKIGDNSHNE